jgi:hypothetical protein
MMDKNKWAGFNWNAYVEKGSTEREQLERYMEVPLKYRNSVASHMKTVLHLRHVKRIVKEEVA